MVTELSGYLEGWHQYFGFCQTPSVLRDLDSWIRRRLRAVAWKQWKRGPKRYRELVRRGIRSDFAALVAGSCVSPWRASKNGALHAALPNALWLRLGLYTLTPSSRA